VAGEGGGGGACVLVKQWIEMWPTQCLERERENSLICFHFNFTHFSLLLFSGNIRPLLSVT
jgi:hypothetical protein